MAAARARRPRQPREQDPAELAVRESLARAQRVWSSGLGTTLVELREADRRLSDKLSGIVARHGGPTGKFTEASAVVYRKQIGVVTEYLEKRLAGHTHARALQAVASGVRDTITVAKAFESRFRGITQPLRLESQQMQDATIRGAGASLLQRHQASFRRYGRAMVSDFERVLRGAQLEGLTHHQTVSRLVQAGALGGHSAASLHANEPKYFPEPTSYVKRRYWAERIVRTETAHALGAGALQAMNVTRQTEFPDLQKKILATFDNRTAADSVAVHGQIRKLEEYFMDGAGRTYLHPPGRPNDREVVIPWRLHWENTETTAPPAPQQVAEAEVAAQAPPPADATERRETLRRNLAAARDRIRGRQQQVQAEQQQAAAAANPKPETVVHADLSQHRQAQRQATAEAVARRRALRQEAIEQRRRERAAAAAVREQERGSRQMLKLRKQQERQHLRDLKKGAEIATNEDLLTATQRLGLKLDGDAQGIRRILGRNLRENELGDLTGARSLRKLGKVTGEIRITENSIRYTLEANGGQGHTGGAELSRIIRKTERGPEVYHSYYFTHKDAQGGGVGGKVLKGMFQTYKDLGIKSVGVSAVDVGQYYWPQIGFEASPDLVRSLKADFGYYLRNKAGLSAEAADKLVGQLKSARDIAITDIPGFKATRVEMGAKGKTEVRHLRAGQDFLIHGSHESVSNLHMTLEDGNPGWEQCKKELGLK